VLTLRRRLTQARRWDAWGVKLEGWNHIPTGYGATFESQSAPWWLRAWFNTPLIDRFAYPLLVRRGFGWLTAFPTSADQHPEPVTHGWRIRPADYLPPGSYGALEPDPEE
jgi:hypothetical protein